MEIFNRCSAVIAAVAAVAALVPLAARAAQGVFVAPTFVTAPVEPRISVPAGRVHVTNLGQLREGSRAFVQVESENRAFPDITALIMSKGDVDASLGGQRVEAIGAQRRAPPFRLSFSAPREAEYVLVLDNRYSMLMTKMAQAKIVVEQKLNTAEIEGITTALTSLVGQIRARYDVPPFDVRVQPCGQVNAFSQKSDGAITLCTEMIAKTTRSPGALIGIVYHEVGHSLLNLWGLPGNDNEDTADEFAVQLAMRSPKDAQVIDQFAAFFEGSAPWLEARAVIQRGDRHTLGVQRARNIRGFVRSAKEMRCNLMPGATSSCSARLHVFRTRGAVAQARQIDEAFASQALACARELELQAAMINFDGGGLAIGHPLGATGARLVGKAASLLQLSVGRFALATQCIGGGQGIATVIERV